MKKKIQNQSNFKNNKVNFTKIFILNRLKIIFLKRNKRLKKIVIFLKTYKFINMTKNKYNLKNLGHLMEFKNTKILFNN